MLPLALYTPSVVAHQLGERVAQLRLARNWKRETLAQRASHALRGLHGVFDDSLPDVPRAQVRETSMRLAEVEAAGGLPRTRPPARRARP